MSRDFLGAELFCSQQKLNYVSPSLIFDYSFELVLH
jgi:hypothetical protein